MNTQEQNVIEEIEAALSQEHLQRVHESNQKVSHAEASKISRIGTLLRYVGVTVLMAAVGSFLFQHWGVLSHLERYFMFLGLTTVVCGAGLVCGISIKENKGARTLLGAVTWLIPVHCAQLGAIIFSQVGIPMQTYPSYFYWHVTSLYDAILALGIGLAMLLPMAYISYAVLARRHAAKLCVLGFGVSSLLLVPSRDPSLVAALLAVSALVVLKLERSFAGISELRTREALVARAVPFLALGMMIGRQCQLYGASLVLFGIICGFASAILFEVMPRLFSGRTATAVAEALSLICAVLSSFCTMGGMVEALRLEHSALAPVAIGLPTAVILFAMATIARELPGAFRTTASASLFLAGAAEMLGAYGVSGCIIALAFGIVSIAWACVVEAKLLLILGGALTAGALVNSAQLALSSFSVSPWITMGLVGVATIVGASYFERNFVVVRDGLIQLRQRVRGWR